MTAAELLRSAQPPTDDGVIEKAIAELDVKIWEWTDALKSAQAQLRAAFAVRPVPKPSSVLYEGISNSLSQAAAAAHVPTPATPPEWAAPPPPPPAHDAGWTPSLPESSGSKPAFAAPAPASSPAFRTPGFEAPAFQAPAATFPPSPPAAATPEWPQAAQPTSFGGHGIQNEPSTPAGAMPWPSAPTGNWPETPAQPTTGSQAWPTWTPTDPSAVAAPAKKSSSVRASRAPKSIRQSLPEGPTPEERAHKAAAEEALLSGLEDAIARRVRLLRRLDPDTPIEKLIEKARQGHAEAQATSATAPRDDKASWWRRK